MVILYQGGVKLFLEKTMRIMGHADYQTTADIYTHLDKEMLRATAADMAGVFKKVNTAARQSRYQPKAQELLASNIIQFPHVGG